MGQAYLCGVIMSYLMQPIGIVLAIILPCLIIMMLEVIKIAKVLSSDKKMKDEEEKAQKDNELEELRRRLAELEKEREEQSR